ncbi:MAG: DoxX family protein [Bacteroidota bacterium]|nr:DoxX family protein [Bacteroidota bacterium]
MKTFVTVARWLVGLLFIFSGLIKANDPLGLSYKMQEFFEAWGWNALDGASLFLSVAMNTFEVLAGVALLVGWRLKLFNWLLLLLILFFTFLTSYVLFSGKIKTCGCFGDCVPLTPIQTFTKDVALTLLILLLFFNTNKMKPWLPSSAAVLTLMVGVAGTLYMQFYVLKHLPFMDCLPYKKGNDLLEQMKKPANATPDEYAYTFVYEKDGKRVEFTEKNLPDNLDSTYIFVERKETLVKKGNGLEAKIVDFSLQSINGSDTTQGILNQQQDYVLLFAKDMEHTAEWKDNFEKICKVAQQKKIPVAIVTADADKAVSIFPKAVILKCDGTVIKTAARVNPTYLMMRGAVVKDKISYVDAKKVFNYLQ